jgi:hypothetical protein
VETGKLLVVDALLDNVGGRAGDKLDDTGGHTSLLEDLVDKVRRVGGSGGGLPDNNVADNGGRADEVTTDGGLSVSESG